MMENELLFLGLLMEGPKHGYDIKRQIEEDLLPHTGLQIKSIYYPLKRMEEAGLIEKSVTRQGRWPEKIVYSITPKGKKRFDALMEESFVSIERPFFQMDLSLYFLPLADKSRAKRRLKARWTLLKKVARQLETLKNTSASKSKSLFLILQHNLDMVEAEIASTERLIRDL